LKKSIIIYFVDLRLSRHIWQIKLNTYIYRDVLHETQVKQGRPKETQPCWLAMQCRPPDRPAPGCRPTRPPADIQTTTDDADKQQTPANKTTLAL